MPGEMEITFDLPVDRKPDNVPGESVAEAQTFKTQSTCLGETVKTMRKKKNRKIMPPPRSSWMQTQPINIFIGYDIMCDLFRRHQDARVDLCD